MRRLVFLLAAWTVLVPASVLAQQSVQEEFGGPDLDQVVWCPCQINMTKAPIRFQTDPEQIGNHFADITVDENSLGGNKCRKGSPEFECGAPMSIMGEGETDVPPFRQSEEPESLGPSFIEPQKVTTLSAVQPGNPYCTEEVIALAKAAGEDGECIQRQELRLQAPFVHDADKAFVYDLRFRMPDTIEDRHSSIRWIIAQWKQEPTSDSYTMQFGEEWAPSPFLAQRFDDGVLHITVQDEHCRCMVASAPFVDGSSPVWKDGVPPYCLSTRPGDPDGQSCTPDLHAEYGPDPVLPSPIGSWVDLTYRVQASRTSPATIEVRDGSRLIVRIIGKIGYLGQPGTASQTKFKIGQYRDYMPFVHTLSIDRISIAPDAP